MRHVATLLCLLVAGCPSGLALNPGLDISQFKTVHADHSEDAAAKGVHLIREGKGEVLMKGSLHTDELMRSVTSGTSGLRKTYMPAFANLNEP